MSWIRDTERDLVNLDKVAQIQVMAADLTSEPPQHVVIASLSTYDEEETPVAARLFDGTEAQCYEFLDKIASKLAMVKL